MLSPAYHRPTLPLSPNCSSDYLHPGTESQLHCMKHIWNSWKTYPYRESLYTNKCLITISSTFSVRKRTDCLWCLLYQNPSWGRRKSTVTVRSNKSVFKVWWLAVIGKSLKHLRESVYSTVQQFRTKTQMTIYQLLHNSWVETAQMYMQQIVGYNFCILCEN